jgi:hypothetical protein
MTFSHRARRRWLGIASGASVALLLAVLAYTAISRKRAAADA